MSRINFLILVGFYLFSCLAGAANLDVTVANSTGNVYAMLNTSNKATLGNGIPACTMIAGYMKQNLTQNTVNMNGRSGIYYLSVQDSEVAAEEVCVGYNTNYKIFKTKVNGIGISFNDADSASASLGQPIGKWPQLTTKFTRSGSSIGIGTWIDIRLWKYSSAADNLPYGIVEITAPTVIQMVGAVAGDTLNSCSSTLATAGSTRVCYTDRRTPKYISSIYASTCNFIGGSKTVQMGRHNISGNVATGYGTEWVDASFQLRCPNAYGYYPDVNNLATVIPNNRVTITVKTRTGVVDANDGIIALDGTGAQGFGIQLAWGRYDNQVSPTFVKLNTELTASMLSSNISASPYNIGSNAVSGDGSVKMAARYVRTAGTFQPGLANASVEILANYQ